MIFIVGAFVFVVWLFRYLAERFRKKAVEKVAVSFALNVERCKINDSIELSLLIQNAKTMFLPIIRIVITVPDSFSSKETSIDVASKKRKTFTAVTSLRSYQQVLNKWRLIPTVRGYYDIHCRITFINFFNTARVEAENIEPVKIIVHPEAFELADVLNTNSSWQGENFVNRFVNHDPLFYLGTRDYSSADSFKDIEWKKSVQQQKLQVKKYEYSSQPELTVLLLAENNAGLNYESGVFIENAVNLAASVIDYSYRHKYSVQFGCNCYGKFHRISRAAEFSHGNIVNIFDELACVSQQVMMSSEELMNTQNVIHNKGYVIIANKYQKKYNYFVQKWLNQQGSVVLFLYDESELPPFDRVTVIKMEHQL